MRRLALLALLAIALSPALALEIPARPTSYVNDYAGVLGANDREALNRDLAAFDKATSNQVFVAVFPGLEGEDHADFGVRLASAWKVGTKKDNGVLLDVFMKERQIGIEVGYGLEGALPDAVCSRIIREEMAPLFKQGDYAGGIRAGVARIQEATRGEYTAAAAGGEEISTLGKAAILLFVVLVIVLQMLFGKRGRSGRWSSGGGFRSSGGGGGFSGGGGGSFGGGGARGGW